MLTGVAIGQMINSTQLSSSGLVKSVGIGIYKDRYCSEAMSSIGWGLVEPGTQYSISQSMFEMREMQMSYWL
jgi:hypothetical protein